jgi:hypothetical protein
MADQLVYNKSALMLELRDLHKDDSDTEADSLVSSFSNALSVADEAGPSALTAPPAKVHELEVGAEKVRQELAVQQRMLAPTSCESVFATALHQALSDGGRQNLKSLQELREYAQREAEAHPERWTSPHAAREIDRIAAERIAAIQTATERVYTGMVRSAVPTHGTAALEAMAACRQLREVVVLPDDVVARLEEAYEQSAIVVLQAVLSMLNGHLKSALTPTSLLGAWDPRWLRGTLSAEYLHRLRQLVQVAERAVGLANVTKHRLAEATQLRTAVDDRLRAVNSLLKQAAEDGTYVSALRGRCRRVQLPQPEEWLRRDGTGGAGGSNGDCDSGETIALETIVAFAERFEQAAQHARDVHRRELDQLRSSWSTASSSAGAQILGEREQLHRRIASLEAANAQQSSEISRLTELLTAARVPFSPPHGHRTPGSPGGALGGGA